MKKLDVNGKWKQTTDDRGTYKNMISFFSCYM